MTRHAGRNRLLCAALALPTLTHAARPMITDDARIVDAKACQVETWVRRNESSTEYWAIPACNPTGKLELSLGGSKTHEAGETHTTQVQMQAKTVFRPLETNGWGVGLAVGHLRHPGSPHRDVAGNLYGYVPVSLSYADDKVVVHTNVGTVRAQDESRHRITWGLGTEVELHPRIFFIPEVFKQEKGRPHFQAGFRFWLVPERVQVDATYGNRLNASSAERWISIGMRLITPAFLP